MFCSRCGEANAIGARFCVQCGAAMPAEFVAAPGSPSVLGLGTPAAAPVPPPQPGPAAETSGKAIASLICGLFIIIFPASVAAIILGHLALSDIRRAAGRMKGHGLAVAGLVLGYSGIFAIPFLLIVAAIAIPNLLRARMAANEASAVGSLRTINTATITYAATYGNGFAPDLKTLDGSGSADCNHAQLIDATLASGQKAGYEFTYLLNVADAGEQKLTQQASANGCTTPGASAYEVHADPITQGTTGQRSFYTDQSGIIRWNASGSATADSTPLE